MPAIRNAYAPPLARFGRSGRQVPVWGLRQAPVAAQAWTGGTGTCKVIRIGPALSCPDADEYRAGGAPARIVAEARMVIAGNLVSTLGIILWLIGVGWWLWFFAQENRATIIRRRSAWNLLSNLSFLGLLIFAAGRALVAVSQPLAR